jgi:long-chain fatty acid transport protein
MLCRGCWRSGVEGEAMDGQHTTYRDSSTGAGSGRCTRRGPPVVLSCVALGLVAASSRSVSATDGLEPIGVSVQAQSRGGADVAVGDTALSQIDNPASVTLGANEVRFDLAEEFIIARTRWTGMSCSAESERVFGLLSNAAVTIPLGRDLSLGFAFHWRDGMGTRYHIRPLMMPLTERRIGSEQYVVDPQVNIGYRLTQKLSVGAGLRIEEVTQEMSTVLGPADVSLGRGYACGTGFQFGVHYQARRDLAFGASYRSPTWFGDMDMPHAKASVYGMGPVAVKDAEIEDFRLPQKIMAGVAWDATDRLKLVGEVRWLDSGDTTLGSTVLTAQGPIFLRIPFPLGYRDQWVFAGGAELKLDRHWTLAGGYHFATQPVDNASLIPTGSVIMQHHITMGLRYEVNNWWVGLGYVWALPTTLSNDGRSDIPLGVDYGHSEMEQQQHGILAGFGFKW